MAKTHLHFELWHDDPDGVADLIHAMHAMAAAKLSPAKVSFSFQGGKVTARRFSDAAKRMAIDVQSRDWVKVGQWKFQGRP